MTRGLRNCEDVSRAVMESYRLSARLSIEHGSQLTTGMQRREFEDLVVCWCNILSLLSSLSSEHGPLWNSVPSSP